MSDFKVKTTFKGIDQYSPTLKAMNRNVRKFQSSTQRAMKGASRSMQSFKGAMGGVLGGAGIIGLTAGAGMAIKKVTGEFVDFDSAVTSAGAKFGKPLLRGTKAFEEFGKVARKVGGETEFTATQAAQGLEFLAMAGFDASQSMKLLPEIVNLATASGTDLARATDIASDSLGAFNLMSKDSAVLQNNLTKVNDVFAKTVTSSNTTLEALFESVKKGAPAFTSAGQSLETFNALVGSLANAGIKGSDSGTALRNMMLRLAAPTGQAAKILTDLNIKTKDSSGNFRDAIDILSDFEKSTKSMGTAQRTAALSTVFGARTVNSINILLSEGATKLKAYREGLMKSSGAGEKMANLMRESIGNQLKSLGSALTEFGFKIVEAFSGKGQGAIQNFTETIRNIDVKPIISTLKIFGKVLDFVIIKPIQGIINLLEWFSFGITKIIKSVDTLKAGFNSLRPGSFLSAIGDLFGGKSDEEKAADSVKPAAPNKASLEAGKINFSGLLNIAGAPANSSIETTTTGAPPIRTELLGAQ